MTHRLRYAERASFCKNKLAQQLLILLDEKQSNLALSADVVHCEALLTLADNLGPEICILKTHVDIVDDFTPSFVKELKALSIKHRFFIFEDRKFADIGHTVKQQYAGGLYQIADWANIITAHALPGPGIISGLREAGLKKQAGLFLLAEMSSEKNLITATYTQETLQMAELFPDFVAGFIAQKKLSDDPQWIYLTPGVQIAKEKDTLGQQYITPEQAIGKNQSDVIIVGRGIIQSKDPLTATKQYREIAWKTYEKRK